MEILVLQHAEVEHPGRFRELLDRDGHRTTTVELDTGGVLPPLDGFDALWVLGGPMDVWQDDAHPWLRAEKELIRHAVTEVGLPYLGLCLGHQLLADALGGEVRPSAVPEVGVLPVYVTEEDGDSDVSLFAGVPESFDTLQWHSAEVTVMPPGAECLATSLDCAIQAMRWGDRAFSAQFHVEVEADTFDNWRAIPEYAMALDKALGPDGARQMRLAIDSGLSDFASITGKIYDNWCEAAARAAAC